VDDADLILELDEAIRTDLDAPVLEQQFNPIDPVAIEIVMHEADFAIENYMKKWESFRDRFSEPMMFDAYVLGYQIRVRRDLKQIIFAAQQFLADAVDPEEEGEEQ
jgi:hypothetical protein